MVEFLEDGGAREWVNLTNMEHFSAVYVEDQLVWARRVLPSESNNPVAWPAKVLLDNIATEYNQHLPVKVVAQHSSIKYCENYMTLLTITKVYS